MQHLFWLLACVILTLVARGVSTNTAAIASPLTSINIDQSNNSTNASTVDILLKYKIKTVQSADVPKVQLQETAAKTTENAAIVANNNSSSNAKSRRKELDSSKVSIDQNSTVTKSNTEQTNKTVHEVSVAEGVTLNVTTKQSMPDKSKGPTSVKEISKDGNAVANNNSVVSTSMNSSASTTTTKISSTTTTTTTTTTSTTTTTTTPKPKPKKPTVVYGVEDFPNLDADHLNIQSAIPHTDAPDSGKQPIPNAEPSQELDASTFNHAHHDYVLPMLSIILLVPLVTIISLKVYRRFRDFWSTRHYRRMDFLVDGMYND